MKSRKKQHLVGTTLLSSEKTRSRKNNRLQDKIAQKWPPTVEEKLNSLGIEHRCLNYSPPLNNKLLYFVFYEKEVQLVKLGGYYCWQS
jgi:hypothetical protein